MNDVSLGMESNMYRKSLGDSSKGTTKQLVRGSQSVEHLDGTTTLHSIPPDVLRLLRDAIIDARQESSHSRAEVLTVQEAADLLRVSKSSIERRIRNQEIPSFKLGRNRRILRRDLFASFDSNLRL